ncbi:MAG: LamG-like jellyroll fold domain-containing protein [Flavobacteriales bacterium]
MKKSLLLAFGLFSQTFSFAGGLNPLGLNFDGIDDAINTNYYNNDGVFTYECWVRSSNAPIGVSYKGPMYSDNAAIIWDHAQSGFSGSASVRDAAGIYYAASFGALNANQWYHLAATYDGSELRAYKNGELISVETTTGGLYPGTSELVIGKHPTIAYYWQGELDEVRVWNYARSCDEINADMNGSVSGNPGSSLVLHYNFDSNASANGNNVSVTTIPNLATSGTIYDGVLSGFAMTGSTSNLVQGAPFGLTVVCSPSAVSEIQAHAISIFPNPVNDILTINTSNSGMVYLVNTLGAIVHQVFVQEKASVNVSALTPGVYFIRMENGTTKRFIKQ